MREIRLQENGRRSRVRHDPFPPALGGLGADTDHTMGGIKIVAPQGTQLLSSQRRIIGQGEHHAITNRFLTRHALRCACHCASVGIHGNLVKRGTSPLARVPPKPLPAV